MADLTVTCPVIQFTPEAWAKYMAYADCNVGKPYTPHVKGWQSKSGKKNAKPYYTFVEISGFGLVRYDEENKIFEVYDMLLMPSEGTGGSTEITNEGFSQVVMDLAEERPEAIEDMRLWWHTHPRGALGWSAQDEKQMDTFGSMNWPWSIGIVTDGTGKYRARLDIWEPYRCSFDGITVKTNVASEDPEEAEMKKQIEDLKKTLSAYQDAKKEELQKGLQEEVTEKVKGKTFPVAKKWESKGGNGRGSVSPFRKRRSQNDLPYGIPLPGPSRPTASDLLEADEVADEDWEYLETLTDEERAILMDPHGWME
jgi:hypothetical protein